MQDRGKEEMTEEGKNGGEKVNWRGIKEKSERKR